MFGFGKKKPAKPLMPEAYNVNVLGLEAAWPQAVSNFFQEANLSSDSTRTGGQKTENVDLDALRIYGYPRHTL